MDVDIYSAACALWQSTTCLIHYALLDFTQIETPFNVSTSTMNIHVILAREISPPPPRPTKKKKITPFSRRVEAHANPIDCNPKPSLAAIEADKVKIDDHLDHQHFKASRQSTTSIPRLSVPNFAALCQINQHSRGCHFFIRQHNHPRAGVHYNLRLQSSETSSISFAIP